MIKNDNGTLSMDFLTAISVLSLVILFSAVQINALMTPYSGDDNFPHLDSTLSVLLSPNNENGLSLPHSDVLDGEKVAEYCVIHENNLNWYELSDTQTFRDFGFQKYQYYSQISPLDITKFDIESAEQSVKNHVPEFGNIELVVRFKTLEYTESGVFYGKDLYGKVNPTKPIILFNKDDINDIDGNITMIFKKFIPKSENEGIKDFRVGYKYDETSEELKPIKHIHPDVFVNGDKITYLNQININLTDTVKIILNQTVLDTKLPEWRNGFAFQFNFDGIEIQNGTTYYNSSIHEISEHYRISVWSW